MWIGAPAPAPSRRIYANAAGVAQAWSEAIAASPGHEAHLEHLAVFTVGENNTISGFRMLAKGSGNRVYVPLSEVVMTAVCANAGGIIIAHNHPVGPAIASADDIEWSKRVLLACDFLGVRLVDSVIVSNQPSLGGKYYSSLREQGHFTKLDVDVMSPERVEQAGDIEKLLLTDPPLICAMFKAAADKGQSPMDFYQAAILSALRAMFLQEEATK